MESLTGDQFCIHGFWLPNCWACSDPFRYSAGVDTRQLQLCPKCNGECNIPEDSLDETRTSATLDMRVCPVCYGRGVI